MAWDSKLPPDDRRLNSPDPPADHNEAVKALAEVRTKLGALPDASAGSLFRWDGSKLVEVAGSATGDALVWDGSAWAADSGTYRKNLPVNLGDPHGWGVIEGSPTFGEYESPTGIVVLGRQSVQPLADGTRERMALPLFIPSTAPSWKLRVYWVYGGTATGDIVITGHIPQNAVQSQGDAFGDESTNTVLNNTTTDPAQDVLQIIEGETESATGFLNMALGTWGTGTLDTGERIHILGAEIVEA